MSAQRPEYQRFRNIAHENGHISYGLPPGRHFPYIIYSRGKFFHTPWWVKGHSFRISTRQQSCLHGASWFKALPDHTCIIFTEVWRLMVIKSTSYLHFWVVIVLTIVDGELIWEVCKLTHWFLEKVALRYSVAVFSVTNIINISSVPVFPNFSESSKN